MLERFKRRPRRRQPVDVPAHDRESSDLCSNPPPGLSFEDAAKRLGISVKTLGREVERGRIATTLIGERERILEGEVERYIAEGPKRAAAKRAAKTENPKSGRKTV